MTFTGGAELPGDNDNDNEVNVPQYSGDNPILVAWLHAHNVTERLFLEAQLAGLELTEANHRPHGASRRELVERYAAEIERIAPIAVRALREFAALAPEAPDERR